MIPEFKFAGTPLISVRPLSLIEVSQLFEASGGGWIEISGFFVLGDNNMTHIVRRNMPEYKSFKDARRRCSPTAKGRDKKNYHEKGIRFRFSTFEEFLERVGPRPTPKHTLDRIDNNGHYEPGNVRWATRRQQVENSSRARFITFNGTTMLLKEWAASAGISGPALYNRLKQGWCVPCAITSPQRPGAVSCPHRNK